MADRILAQIATLGPVGKLPAPGTAGSFVALLAGAAILYHFGQGVLVLALIVVSLLAFPTIEAHERLTGEHDSKSVIIDEVVGQWLAMLVIPLTFGVVGFWASVVACFVLFRFFDIRKPGPVGSAEKIPGAAGVIADDAIAGILAGGVILGCSIIVEMTG